MFLIGFDLNQFEKHWKVNLTIFELGAGIADEEMKKLLALDLSTSTSEYAIDIRDSAVQWVNDIEYDKQYRKWSDSLLDLLRPTFPGMLRSIRRNLYNLVSVLPGSGRLKNLSSIRAETID